MDIEEILVFLRNQNYLDVALYVVFIYALLSGWRKGSFINIYYLLTLALGIGLGFRYSNFLGLLIQTWLNSETQISKIIAGVIIILGVSTASSVLLSILPSRLKANPIDFGSRFFGSIFSFIWVNLFFCIFFSFVSLFSLPNTVKQINQESKLVNLLSTLSFAETKKIGSVGCKVASILRGEADVYISLSGETSPKDWDMAAPEALLRSAGGLFTHVDLSQLVYNSGDLNQTGCLIASHGKSHQKICRKAMDFFSEKEPNYIV